MTEKEKMAAVAEEETKVNAQEVKDHELSENELENVAGGGPTYRHR